MATSGIYNVDTLIGDGSARVNASDLPGTSAVLTYSFMESQPDYSYFGSDAIYGFSPFNDAMKAATPEVLSLYSAVATIEFVEVSDAGAGGAMRLGTYSSAAGFDSSFYVGYAYLPSVWNAPSDSDVWLSNGIADNLAPTRGTEGFHTLMHEIGHALGFKHPGNYSGYEDPPFLSAADDTTANTVMSYNGVGTSDLGPLDTLAISWLYGPRGGGTIGTLTVGTDVSETFNAHASGGFVHGQGGNDSIYGSSAADGISGGANEDFILGAQGADTLYGGDGFDTLYGGDGSDSLNGNQHADMVYGEGGDDVAVRGGKGADAVYGNAGNDSVYGDLDNDTVHGGQGSDLLHGGKNDDLMYGDMGNDTLSGDLGNDSLYGGGGGDTFVLRADGGTDVVFDFSAAEGDRVAVSGSWTTTQTAEGVRVDSTTGDGTLLLSGVSNIDYWSITWWWG